jgi:hypothetical protein
VTEREAALADAVRAICAWCTQGFTLEHLPKGWWHPYIHDAPLTLPDGVRCNAGPIHDLIAAIDKETK